MPVKPKYGTLVKFGTGAKFGYGTSEPWSPLDTPATVDRFAVESLSDPTPTATPDSDSSPSFTPDSAATPTYTPDP